MDIKLSTKLIRDIKAQPERFSFGIVNNNVVLNVDNVATNTIFAIPETQTRVKYVKSYKINEDTITIKTVNI